MEGRSRLSSRGKNPRQDCDSQVSPIDPPPAVVVKNVQFAWQRDGFAMRVDDFAVAEGERILITAPSGAGKSTLISLIAGIARPQSGSIRIAGTDIVTLQQARRDSFRAERIGLIFQNFNLIPYLTALENVVLPLAFAPARLRRAGGHAAARALAESMLEQIGLPVRQFGTRRASQLSIGQQQRVAALRAMIGAPDLIIADEPTSALDLGRQAAFLDMLHGQLTGSKASLIMVSHDPTLRGFDRVVPLDSIAIVEQVR